MSVIEQLQQTRFSVCGKMYFGKISFGKIEARHTHTLSFNNMDVFSERIQFILATTLFKLCLHFHRRSIIRCLQRRYTTFRRNWIPDRNNENVYNFSLYYYEYSSLARATRVANTLRSHSCFRPSSGESYIRFRNLSICVFSLITDSAYPITPV